MSSNDKANSKRKFLGKRRSKKKFRGRRPGESAEPTPFEENVEEMPTEPMNISMTTSQNTSQVSF